MNEVMLDSAIISALNDELQEKDKQLQAHKQKEERLREYINLHKTVLPLEYSIVDYIDYLMDCEPILQILNDRVVE